MCWGERHPPVPPVLSRPDQHLEYNVAVGFIELPVESFLHQHWHEILYLPDGQAGQLAHVLRKELRVVEARLLQALLPAPCFAPWGVGVSSLLWSQTPSLSGSPTFRLSAPLCALPGAC